MKINRRLRIFNTFFWKRHRLELAFAMPLANIAIILSLGLFYLKGLAAAERYYLETTPLALALPSAGLASYRSFLTVFGIFMLASLFLNVFYARTIFHPLHEIISVAKDVSKGSLSKRIKIKADDEIGLLARVINNMLDSIAALNQKMSEEKSLAYLGTMVAGIAHEIRNPIASIKTLIELVETTPEEDEKRAEYFQAIHGEVNKLDRLIRKLFAFSKPIKSNSVRLQPNELLEELCQEINNNLKFNKIRIIKQLNSELPMVVIDKNELHQVFYNLLLNAVEATDYEGEIVVASHRAAAASLPFQKLSGGAFGRGDTEGFVEISIKDNGCGFDINNFEKLFKPFLSTKQDSTGLGLAIVSKIIENYNGRIGASSQTGKGSTFYLYLPIAEKQGAGKANE